MLMVEMTDGIRDIAMATVELEEEVMQKASNQDKYFKGQQAHEEVVCFFRRHWISLIVPIMGFVLVMGLIGVIVAAITNTESLFGSSFLLKAFYLLFFIGLTFYLHHFFMKIIQYFLSVVIITNQRLIDIHKSIYIKHTLDAVDLTQIQDVAKKQEGLLKNLLKYGELIITLSSTATTKTLTVVPKADFHFRAINRCIQAAKKGLDVRKHHGVKAKSTEESSQLVSN